MQRIQRLAALLALSLAVAGCSGAGSTPSSSSGAGTTTGAGTTIGTSTSLGINRAPVANLTVDVSGLTVNATLKGTDPDGDDLTYRLSFGDGSTNKTGSLPANVTHSYAMAGTYNLTFTVSDGKLNATRTLPVALTGGAPITLAGNAQLPCPQCNGGGPNSGVGFRAGESGLDSYFVEVGPEVEGRVFSLTSTGGDPNVSFRDGCDGGAAVGDAFAGSGPEAGIVPAGARCVLLWETAMPDSDFTMAIT